MSTETRTPSKRGGRARRHLFAVPRLRKRSKPGAVAGIELSELTGTTPSTAAVSVTCIDYGPQQARVQQVEDLTTFLSTHRPDWTAVRWINVDGLGDLRVIRGLAEKYHLHPLAIQDLLHVTHRPKVEAYEA